MAGERAYAQRDYRSAREAYREAIVHDPDNAAAHYNLGLIMHVVDNNLAGAEAEYRNAIELEPDMALALFNLGVIRSGAGDKAEAKALYRRAIEADPELASAHLNLGFVLYEEDPASADAQAAFAKAVTLQPALSSRVPATTSTTVAP